MASIEVFCCYAHKDAPLLTDLKAHLTLLQKQGLIALWTDTNISPGSNWEQEIEKHLNTAHVILLLVSSDLMPSRKLWCAVEHGLISPTQSGRIWRDILGSSY